MIVSCRSRATASDAQIIAEMSDVLNRRGALMHPPSSLSVSDPVARGIAGLLSSPTPSGQVLEHFHRTGSMDSAELLEAARTEQGYASPEGYAALHCLIVWVNARVYRQESEAARA